MNDAETLLAKSSPQVTLEQHILDGLTVLQEIKKAIPGLSALVDFKIWELAQLTIIFHDVGKAHKEFQNLLRKQKDAWYGQRHELFSLPIAEHVELPSKEKQYFLWVIAGHHRDFICLKMFVDNNYEIGTEEFKSEFELVPLEKVKSILKKLNIHFPDSIKEPVHPKTILDSYPGDLGEKTIYDELLPLTLLKGVFEHCDHLSSAFITTILNLTSSDFDFLDKLQKKLNESGKDFYDHQKEASGSKGNVLLKAPTGTGKTESAILWLRNNIAEKPGRAFYVLPYTASINAMYKRLSKDKVLGPEKVGMLHGKMDAFFYDIFQEEGSLSERNDKVRQLKSQFKTLQTPLKVTTPFQLLKHLFGLKGWEKGVTEWAGGYFIFDEIHAYEPTVVAQLKLLVEFITAKLGGRVFIMTATLPSFLEKLFVENISDNKVITASDTIYQNLKRHKIKVQQGALLDNLEKIKQATQVYKKILVVVNSVDDAQVAFEELRTVAGKVKLLHSRFSGEERSLIENNISHEEVELLIGTQAIEVSLDIDYDILFTECAPLDALIQRFGRVNRKNEKPRSECMVFEKYSKTSEQIYRKELLDDTVKALKQAISANNGNIDEKHYQQMLDEVYPSYTEQEWEDFNLTYESFKNHLPQPFYSSKEREEDFYRQFEGAKVLPVEFEEEYKQRLDDYDFIGAELLKVQISKRRFVQFLSDGTLIKDEHVLVTERKHQNDKLTQIDFYKIKKKYEPEIGLRYNKDAQVNPNNSLI